jgi:hypothetical protein
MDDQVIFNIRMFQSMQKDKKDFQNFYSVFFEKEEMRVHNNMFMQYLTYHHATMDEQQRLDMDFFKEAIKRKAKKDVLTAPIERKKDTKNCRESDGIDVCVKTASDCVLSKDDIAIAYLGLTSAMTEHQRNLKEPRDDKKK